MYILCVELVLVKCKLNLNFNLHLTYIHANPPQSQIASGQRFIMCPFRFQTLKVPFGVVGRRAKPSMYHLWLPHKGLWGHTLSGRLQSVVFG